MDAGTWGGGVLRGGVSFCKALYIGRMTHAYCIIVWGLLSSITLELIGSWRLSSSTKNMLKLSSYLSKVMTDTCPSYYFWDKNIKWNRACAHCSHFPLMSGFKSQTSIDWRIDAISYPPVYSRWSWSTGRRKPGGTMELYLKLTHELTLAFNHLFDYCAFHFQAYRNVSRMCTDIDQAVGYNGWWFYQIPRFTSKQDPTSPQIFTIHHL